MLKKSSQLVTDDDRHFMAEAVRLSEESIRKGGGPFGAVIVKDGKIVAGSHNSVTILNDPTAHAEVMTIREACKALGTFDLSGCTVYTSCEPCPMCLGAIYWARIEKLFYANTHDNADKIGFSDADIYREIAKKIGHRSIPEIHIDDPDAIRAFNIWEQSTVKTEY